MKAAFTSTALRKVSLELIEQCNAIIAEYSAQGLILTLRQLYYQFVSRDLLPNNERSYKNLGNAVSKGRLAGLIDWDAIEDRGRRPDIQSQWNSIQSLVESALRAYRLPRWQGQQNYVELWVEKAALAGVLEPLAQEYHVTLMVNKGYSSQSAMYESATRIQSNTTMVKPDAYVLYLGDHDPSGEDMVRDIEDRLNMFLRRRRALTVNKIALTWAQIQEHQPPPNPTKLTDSRAARYIEKYGEECWEVDALDPNTLQELVRNAILELVDLEAMDEIKEREAEDKEKLRAAAEDL